MGIVPSFFNINEPILFGAPIIMNPMMFIPFVFVPMINAVLAGDVSAGSARSFR
jgi:PTS system cellobiose-specific IIC component